MKAVWTYSTPWAASSMPAPPVWRTASSPPQSPLPANIADNFRPATMSMYAAADNSAREAIGVNRNFYVAGYTEPEREDTIAPLIESMVLNHSEFKPGDTTDANPLLIAAVSDDVGINLSSAGVGFQITPYPRRQDHLQRHSLVLHPHGRRQPRRCDKLPP